MKGIVVLLKMHSRNVQPDALRHNTRAAGADILLAARLAAQLAAQVYN
jgi:hypothetical protein